MNYQDYQKLYTTLTKTSLAIVHHMESKLSPERPKGIQTSEIPDWLWEVICQNIIKLKGVERKLGGPYAVHPTRMALALLEIIPDTNISFDSAAYAAVHDYLEEGDGRSPKAYADALKVFGNNSHKCDAMVLLSEPELDYSSFNLPLRLAEYIGYHWQLQTNKKLSEAHLNACFMDKIDNGQSWDYVLHKKGWNDERKQKHLIMKTVIQLVLLDEYGSTANSTMTDFLTENIQENRTKYQISTQTIQEQTKRYKDLLLEHESVFKKAILNYHKEMDL